MKDASDVRELFESALLSRRTLLVGGGAAAASATILTHASVFAQDATPAAASAESNGTPVAVDATPAPLGPAIPPETSASPTDWPVAQGDLAATRNAASTTIDSTTVNQLGVAWQLPIEAISGFGAITSNPVVIGDVVYVIDNAATIQAVKKDTGEVIWKNVYNVSTYGPNGVAVGYGYLVGVLGDACTVITLKADTGEEVWRFQLANHNALGITMAPLIYNGQIIVSTEPGGNSKGTYEGGANGVVYCLDLQTGETQWTWDTVKDDLWGDFRVNSGGGLWYPPSVDENGVFYMGIGNAAPFPGTADDPNASSRPGPNDYANNLVALHPNQGKLLWNLNVKPHDLFDHDNQQTPVLGTVQIGGVDVHAVYSSGKHGFVVAVERTSGIEIWRTPVGKHENDLLQTLPADGSSVEVFPGVFGGVESPLAFKDGVVYAAIFNLATYWGINGADFSKGFDFSTADGQVVAIDGASGQILWDVTVPSGLSGPGPTIANDLLFTGGLDGIVRAFSLKDGSIVWKSQTTAGLNAPFAIAGDYLFVPAGGPLTASADVQGELPAAAATLIAYKIGATGAVATGTPVPVATPAASATDNTVEMIDIAFKPKTLTIAANTDVTINLINAGAAVHNFNIDELNIYSGDYAPGQSGTVTVNAAAGTYQYYCNIPGHKEAGMVGTLTVQ